jgi:uncharacterized protein YndB with AHSA1/START domain
MIDIVREIEAVQRELGPGRTAAGEGRSIRLRRTYDAPIDDVWDALTNPERINRWFLPISGDFRIGGRYQFEGNAGGEIVSCDRPNRLHVTWVYGEPASPSDISEVELRLKPSGGERTEFVLEHTAIVPEEMWNEYGPGAVGVGWDGGLLGLALHLQGGSIDDPIAWQTSDEGREWNTRSSEAWGAAHAAAGADPEAVERGVRNSTLFYAPPPEAQPESQGR